MAFFNGLLDPQADAWYREAVALAKPDTLRPWDRIVDLYSKAVERGHWKAMHNLASLYRTGWPGGVEKDTRRPQKLSATPDLSGTVLPHVLFRTQ
ncbi:hypothetical protein QOU18_29150, partial [Pseudomonas aeruginosa]